MLFYNQINPFFYIIKLFSASKIRFYEIKAIYVGTYKRIKTTEGRKEFMWSVVKTN